MNNSVHWQSLYSVVGNPWKVEIKKELQPYWLFRDEIAIIDGIVIEGRRIIISTSLQDKALKQLHINHVGIENN